MKRVYLDHAAGIGNPSSVHHEGRKAKKILDDARAKIGAVLNCRAEEIIFTGSGTEANNLAIFGVPSGHIISTNIEHHSVLRPLEKRGNVTFVPVKPNGIINPDDIAKALRPDTVLVSVIYANNEIGTTQPIRAIKKIIGNVLLHTDACQAAGYLDINVQNLGVDLMTINGAKIYGPQGTGVLFVRRGTRLMPIILGGDQERGLRAGTQNPVLIADFAKALKLAEKKREKESARLINLRDWFIAQLPDAKLNGDPVQRLPNNINISFDDIDGEMLMLALDLKGIAVSTGAACTVTSTEPSHVLQALHATRDTLHDQGNIRLTLGRSTTKKDLEYTLQVLKKEVARLRSL
ncbi:MAG: cysteine desulfurase family protein [Patescibacteria group bacterium]|mgnify:CR=1 FL=1